MDKGPPYPDASGRGRGDESTSKRDEIDRIRHEYEQRATRNRLAELYGQDDIANSIAIRERSARTVSILRREVGDLRHLRILDVGCGYGGEMDRLVNKGATPLNLVGLDLMPSRLTNASRLVPGALLVLADAGRMPLRAWTFDLVIAFTVFSSILDDELLSLVCSEIARVLKPGGVVLWYDFRWNPMNRQTRGIGPRAIRRLFPGWIHRSELVTLAPPIARTVAPRSERLAQNLHRIVPLRSHHLGIARKPGAEDG